MKYLIDSIVVFDDKNGLLENKNSGTSVVLSTTAIRILSFLLKNQGVVLSRDEFFETVWDAYGQEASNNSLNQYLSVLRKAFRNVGLEHEIIITVPKQGFLIKVDVEYDEEDLLALETHYHTSTETVAEPYNLNLNVAITDVEAIQKKQLTAENLSDKAHKCNRFSFSKRNNWLKVFAFFVLICTIAFVYQYWPSSSKAIPTVQLHSIGKIDTCPVFTFYESSEEMLQTKMNIARKMTIEHKLPCIPNAIYIFQPDDMFVYNQKGHVLLSRCTTRKNDPLHGLAGCKDIYVYEK